METNIRTNIGGFIFNVEQSAYQVLEAYLEKIKASFSSSDEAEEISNDIEYRIAELLKERGIDEDSIVELKTVNEIIAILGYPDDDDEMEYPDDDEEHETELKSTKKFFRHPEDRYLGGVSAGLAAYFRINVNIVRGLFVLLSFLSGFGILLYLILWIITPEAKTRIQLLQMKGKKPNFDNIEEAVKDEFKAVKNSFNTLKETRGFKQFPKAINKILRAFLNIFIFFFKSIAFFIAFIALIVSTALLFAFVSSLFFPASIFSPLGWMNAPIDANFVHWIFPFGDLLMLKLGILLFVGIPTLFILMGSIRVLFNIRGRKNKIVRATGLVAWLLGIFMLAGIGLNEYRSMAYAYDGEESTPLNLKAFNSDTLYVDALQQNGETLRIFDGEFQLDDTRWLIDDNNSHLIGRSRVYFRVSEDSSYHIKVVCSAAESTTKKAKEAAENITYSWQQQDSLLKLNNYFELKDKSNNWKKQQARIYVYVPAGKYVRLLESTKDLKLDGIYNYSWGKTALWKATKDDFVSMEQDLSDDDAANVDVEVNEDMPTIDSSNVSDQEMLNEMKDEINK
jgi:phage shock protein PspC (stress-responsive transcriptional regulator)